MRKFSSHRFYNLIKYGSMALAVFGLFLGLAMVLYANTESTWTRYFDACDRTQSTSIGRVITARDCVKVANDDMAGYKNMAIGNVIVYSIPMVLFYSIRWGYVFLFPKQSKDKNEKVSE